MICCTLFWTFIYHQDHVFFEWKCVLFLPSSLPHIIYFIRLFWKYLMLIRNVICMSRIIFFESNALFFQKFLQTDLPKRRLMLGLSWCLGNKKIVDFAKVKKIIWQKRRLQVFCQWGKFPSECRNLCSLLTYLNAQVILQNNLIFSLESVLALGNLEIFYGAFLLLLIESHNWVTLNKIVKILKQKQLTEKCVEHFLLLQSNSSQAVTSFTILFSISKSWDLRIQSWELYNNKYTMASNAKIKDTVLKVI